MSISSMYGAVSCIYIHIYICIYVHPYQCIKACTYIYMRIQILIERYGWGYRPWLPSDCSFSSEFPAGNCRGGPPCLLAAPAYIVAYIHISTCLYIHMHTYEYNIYLCIWIYMNIYMNIHIYTYEYTYIYMYMFVHMTVTEDPCFLRHPIYRCIYVYVYLNTYFICIYICIYVYICHRRCDWEPVCITVDPARCALNPLSAFALACVCVCVCVHGHWIHYPHSL